MLPRLSLASFTLLTALSAPASIFAQIPPVEEQIAAAVAPAPEDMREDAKVLGYDASGNLVTLREGPGKLVCLADEPGDDRFHVACYFRELEPFMQRGRALRAEGRTRDEIERIREEEIAAGTLPMPSEPAALYSLTGPVDSFDPESGTIDGASPLYVVYIPYATSESTGLPPHPAGPGVPWLMAGGKPWAHIMIVPPSDEDDQNP